MLIQDLLNDIKREVTSVSPEATVYSAIKLMAERDFGAVAVVDGDRMMGIFTERDYARKLLLEGKSSMLTKIKDTMSPEVIQVRPDQSIHECLETMVDHGIRHLPVIEGGHLMGLVSMADLAKAAIQGPVAQAP
ncbi:MAG: CBS domain-containing protein [Candidatus Neomarinimicrobiota bacterium]